MTQNVNDPAATAIANRVGSTNPTKDQEMNKANDITGAAKAPVLSRRWFLGGVAITAIPSGAVALSEEIPQISIDAFLAKAMPAEKARYHANALAEVMAEMHPHLNWHSVIDHKYHFAMINGSDRKRRAPIAKVHVDDGSPLLADDVTGTTAFADWEASR